MDWFWLLLPPFPPRYSPRIDSHNISEFLLVKHQLCPEFSNLVIIIITHTPTLHPFLAFVKSFLGLILRYFLRNIQIKKEPLSDEGEGNISSKTGCMYALVVASRYPFYLFT